MLKGLKMVKAPNNAVRISNQYDSPQGLRELLRSKSFREGCAVRCQRERLSPDHSSLKLSTWREASLSTKNRPQISRLDCDQGALDVD